jgi:hypothetical protein
VRDVSYPLAVAVAVAVALTAGFAVAVQAADPRLDEADMALQKARALLVASQHQGTSPQVQKEFERNVARAVALIDRARAHAQAAKDASNGEIDGTAGLGPGDGSGKETP